MDIAHGFFDSPTLEEAPRQIDPIIVGAHTIWGEMRSVRHAVRVLASLLMNHADLSVIGYLGGAPSSELQLTLLDEMFVEAGLPSFELVQASRLSLPINRPSHPLVVVCHEDVMPRQINLTFNLQLYHLGAKVRTGENSGSLHRGFSIPVVLEMNSAEVSEKLSVIKVPYSNLEDIESADWSAGAAKIAECIESGDYLKALEANQTRRLELSPAFVAGGYLREFKLLSGI